MRVLTAAALDVRMRMRRRGFLMLCLILLVSAFGFVPRESGVSVLVIEGFRPLSDPSWIPTACAQAAAVFLPIAGFVYVRTSLDTDRRTGVAAAVRASGAGRAAYFLGKYAANLVLLLALLAVMLLGALIMMLLRFPGQGCSVWAFVSPFFAAAPGLCLVAGLALLLEVPGRTPAGRALGNAMFAALWLTLFSLGVILPAESASPAVRTLGCFLEFTGYGWQSASLEMQTGAHANYFLSWVPEGSEALPPLAFSGLAWDPRQFAAKLLLLFIGPALALFAAALYPRQEKARAVRRDGKARTDAPRPKRQGGRLPGMAAPPCRRVPPFLHGPSPRLGIGFGWRLDRLPVRAPRAGAVGAFSVGNGRRFPAVRTNGLPPAEAWAAGTGAHGGGRAASPTDGGMGSGNAGLYPGGAAGCSARGAGGRMECGGGLSGSRGSRPRCCADVRSLYPIGAAV